MASEDRDIESLINRRYDSKHVVAAVRHASNRTMRGAYELLSATEGRTFTGKVNPLPKSYLDRNS